MKHNQHNATFPFCHSPTAFNKWTEKAFLQYCLGGTLYMPGTRVIVDKLLDKSLSELKSMVMCFEDAIREEDVGQAEQNVLQHLERLAAAVEADELSWNDLPLIFLRVRTAEQFIRFAEKIGAEQAQVLSGFVFPKFYSSNAHIYLEKLQDINDRLGVTLYGMPILEGKAIAYQETRSGELCRLREILHPHKSLILNIRVGGTDFSSLFGVRRSINSSIYDILPVRDALSEILNFFNRVEDGYTVSAPVWEYFLAYKQDDMDELLKHNLHGSLMTKTPILNDAVDGLLRELLIDKTNGFVGKTVIHPSHLRYVNAMQAVTEEEYNDAMQILDAGGGVIKSGNANKMNEIGPHRSWATRVELRARAYGVIADEDEYLKLFQSGD
ncbi:HpcH/HpaI aldolase/citrate lyase family protein [Halomonas campisalis]|uniref:HpcH/HpaI aldolase/citrate lyase family protein n=1 Tax=Billgrantia campisalis TaxID=74661 RepID=A0ABS9P520_9GAMM|nr:HpcH/HpaI aldolase/citrate lyase family protein [Halomonas campisalis]MCG6656347.1 HpcH/HpaI aldolase/citrate lyase family protein [Halomonas campisalis]MDR5861531.1 HpcH/HpaI aldolase/citrate lyase family protein [Halomonas campisalis]